MKQITSLASMSPFSYQPISLHPFTPLETFRNKLPTVLVCTYSFPLEFNLKPTAVWLQSPQFHQNAMIRKSNLIVNSSDFSILTFATCDHVNVVFPLGRLSSLASEDTILFWFLAAIAGILYSLFL